MTSSKPGWLWRRSRERRPFSEIATQFEFHPNQIMKSKGQLLENVGGVFSRKQEAEVEEMKELINKLYKKIGE
jgi:hypothetical protein